MSQEPGLPGRAGDGGPGGIAAVPVRSVLARRRRAAAAVVGAAVLLSAGGFAAGLLVKSPAQVAAATGPPAPTAISAPVVRRVLSQAVVMRGVFALRRQYPVAPASVAASPGNPGGGALVVTGMYVRRGDRVRSGELLAEVSDRPVFVFEGPLPLWRDILPGESGKDVAEVQAALAALGFSPGADSPGYFGSGTRSAVAAFYRAAGYQPAVTATSPGQGAGCPGCGGRRPALVMVPDSEFWFVPHLPAYVSAVSSRVGQVVREPLFELTPSGLVLTGQLDPSQAGLVKAGMRAAILSEVTGYQGTGTVTSVGRLVIAGGTSYLPVAIRPSAGRWPGSLAGQNVRITIIAASTTGPVLAVPVAAVSSNAAGQVSVTVIGRGGRQRRVVVRAGVSAGGYVQVTPLRGALAAGDRVVVGLNG